MMEDNISDADEGGSEDTHSTMPLARAADVLPRLIHLLPSPARPFFPGQIMPLMLSSARWTDTLQAVRESQHGVIGVVFTRNEQAEDATPADFYTMGTACRLHHAEQQEKVLHVVLVGVQRFKIVDWISSKPPFQIRVDYYPETDYKDVPEIKAYVTAIINIIKELLPLNPLYGEELKMFLQNYRPDNPSYLADFAASLTTASPKELQQVLEAIHIRPRLEKALVLVNKELQVAKAQMEIRQHVEGEMQSRQREVFLREQLKFIQNELGISKDDRTAELERFRQRIDSRTIPSPVSKRIEEELQKFKVLEMGSPEYTVTRNYLDWLTGLPWNQYSKDNLDLDRAAEILEHDHDGLEDVKERILEFLGVGIIKGDVSGSVLLFVGPPGVGKTSLGRSIARAMGRTFYRFSLGGMRDEAEIKGHRRTYIGAMPGKFIQAVKESGTANPIIMLDEIDKIGASFRGDPASALLEVLDPEENHDFLDHYLDVRFDLSKILFICTANQLDTIPAPLLDRMEVIALSGYLASEKLLIARNHLIPRLLHSAGLKKRGQLRIEPAALKKIIEQYAREAGVRRLEKLLRKIVRKAVMKILRDKVKSVHVRAGDVEKYLGSPVFRKDRRITGVGIVTGLAWTAMGGATLSVEASKSHGFSRGFKLTGQLGNVMRESAEIAYSYIVSNAKPFGVKPEFFEQAFIHIHVPAGATPKDGPSAGITMASALLSLARRRRPKNMAMTGELTLTGHVLPVGGIKEKILAAKRVGISEVILPESNQGDFEELPSAVVADVNVNFVDHYKKVVSYLFD